MKKINQSPEMLIVAVGLFFASILMLVSLFYTPPLSTATVIYSKDSSVTNNSSSSQEEVLSTVAKEEFLTKSTDTVLVNINTATLEELTSITGIGETKAQKVIDYRNSNGAFKSTDEIMLVNGIGEKTYESIKDNICV